MEWLAPILESLGGYLLIIEAFIALIIFVFIVWWTTRGIK